MKYLFKGKIQVGLNDNPCWGLFHPKKEMKDPDFYNHMICLGRYYICW